MFIQLILAIAVPVLVHLLAMALSARVTSITVRDITFGLGPRLFTIGMFHVALLPFGGNVRLAMLADLSADEDEGNAFDMQPAWKRVLLPLSGPLALLGLGYVLLGASAMDRLNEGFAQWLGGAISPLGQAQTLLHAFAARLPQMSLTVLIGVAACKFAALNLIPYASSNGLQAIVGTLPPHSPATVRFTRTLSRAMLPLTLLLYGSWLLAILAFLFRA
jgi:membrane-associated protease RseP (regulator of RpoE activity)